MKKTVGLIGLGKMGLPVAANLLEHGFPVLGYRRHMIDDFVTMGGKPAQSSEDVARQCDVVITCLPDDQHYSIRFRASTDLFMEHILD